jgi:DNA (cytosine-5)-methyltransferase 1
MADLSISLFSGAGGFDIGLEVGGLVMATAQEFDKDAVATLRSNGRQVIDGDIRELLRRDPTCRSFNCRRPFAVVGGPPCQAFSPAGKRGGMSDHRGVLYKSFLAVVEALNPRFVVMENVRGLAWLPGLLARILSDFRKTGYATVHGVLDAADYGAPQHRERLIIIGSRDGERVRLPDATHAGEWRTFADAVRDIKDDGLGVSFSPRVQRLLAHVPEGGNWRSLPLRLQKEALGNADTRTGGFCGVLRRLSFKKPSPTLVTSPTQRATLLAHPRETRPLSVCEYARVQGFPDSWKFHGGAASQYRQIGNAVPIALGEAIGRTLTLGG